MICQYNFRTKLAQKKQVDEFIDSSDEDAQQEVQEDEDDKLPTIEQGKTFNLDLDNMLN